MIATPQIITYYRSRSGHAYFEEWFNSLEIRLQAIVSSRIERVANGNFGDCKPYDEIFELRIHDGPGYRIFFGREGKFARRWLTSKGILAQEEAKNPVDTELEHFFEGCRASKTIVSPIEIGMNDAIAVILSNLAMDEGRKVYFNEIENMGLEPEKKRT